MKLPLGPAAADFVELRFKPGTWETVGVPERGCRIRTSTLERLIGQGGRYDVEDLILGLMDWLDVTDEPAEPLFTLRMLLDRHYPDDGRATARCQFADELIPDRIFHVAGMINCTAPVIAWQRRQWVTAVACASEEPGRMLVAAPGPISLEVAQSILDHARIGDAAKPFDSINGLRASSHRLRTSSGWESGTATLINWPNGLGLAMRDGQLLWDSDLIQPPATGWLPASQLAMQVAIASGYAKAALTEREMPPFELLPEQETRTSYPIRSEKPMPNPSTSHTNPLLIAEVRAGPDCGRIGITLCPGKKDPLAWSGACERDLSADVEAIRQWGAAVVVTLIEPHEIETLQVQRLGEEIERQHMEWLHLPIRDVDVPGPFEQAWKQQGAGLRARLRDGFDVLVHCRGGLGRAGTIAARLLVELGAEPEQAIREVRKVRPGAIQTKAQEAFVRARHFITEPQPSRTAEAILDRAKGALVGLAVGDALGTTLEFEPRDSYPPLTDIVGGGPFHLRAGEWTDDTAMALALAESLLACGDLDPADLMRRFVDWWESGAYSCTGSCFDIGNTTSAALSRYKRTGDPFAGSTDPMSAGNGSLMRLAPVAIRYWEDREKLRQVAADQSRTTHGAPEAVGACVAYAEILAVAIEGQPRSEVMRSLSGDYPSGVAAILAGTWRDKARDQVQSSGFVLHSLEAALWSVGRTADFRSAVLTAANLGGDADTTAAIAGQLAGALYGLSGIPDEWLGKLAWRERIEGLADRLASIAGGVG